MYCYLLAIYRSRTSPIWGKYMFGHTSPADRGRELFKPSKDCESSVVSIFKKLGIFLFETFLERHDWCW